MRIRTVDNLRKKSLNRKGAQERNKPRYKRRKIIKSFGRIKRKTWIVWAFGSSPTPWQIILAFSICNIVRLREKGGGHCRQGVCRVVEWCNSDDIKRCIVFFVMLCLGSEGCAKNNYTPNANESAKSISNWYKLLLFPIKFTPMKRW